VDSFQPINIDKKSNKKMVVIMKIVMNIFSIIAVAPMTTTIYLDTDSAHRSLYGVDVGSVTDVSEVHVPPS
jgi:hypothetical protein